MITAIAIGVGGALLLMASIPAMRAVWDVWRFRGRHVVRCPEVGRPAGVAVDIRELTLATLGGARGLRIGACSRWRARRDCAQRCVPQVVQGPGETRPRTLFTLWYLGRACALCASPLHRIGEPPAVRWLDGRTARWSVFRRLYPGGDRPWTRDAARAAARRAAAASRA